MVVIIGALLLLAACQPPPVPLAAATPLPAPTVTPLPAPTATAPFAPSPVPTVTATATLEIPTPTPKPTISPERAGGLTGVPYPDKKLVEEGYRKFNLSSQGMEAGKLVYEQRPNLNDPNKSPIVFARDPATKDIILAAKSNPKTHEYEWKPVALRDLADALGIDIGVTLSVDIPATLDVMKNEFNLGVISFNWKRREPERSNFETEWPDSQASYAKTHNMKGFLVQLMYPEEIPDWVKEIPELVKRGELTQEQLREQLLSLA
jgi:hypothetical protein